MARPLKRFLVSSSLGSRRVFLTPEETHHVKHVLRMKEGAFCLLFDREGNEFLSRLEHLRSDSRARATLIEPMSRRAQDWLELTVAQAIPQDRKMDEMVRKAAELGVFELIPMTTERTVVRMTDERFRKARARWSRIAEQSLKQSRLRKAPEIGHLSSFPALCSSASKYDHFFLFDPSGKRIRECIPFSPVPSKQTRFLLAIGPEGGFSSLEVEQAKKAGAQIVRMGSGILKTDTAFVASVSFLRLMCGREDLWPN